MYMYTLLEIPILQSTSYVLLSACVDRVLHWCQCNHHSIWAAQGDVREWDLHRGNEHQGVGKHQSHRVSRGIITAHSKIVASAVNLSVDSTQVGCVYDAAFAIDRFDVVPERRINAGKECVAICWRLTGDVLMHI